MISSHEKVLIKNSISIAVISPNGIMIYRWENVASFTQIIYGTALSSWMASAAVRAKVVSNEYGYRSTLCRSSRKYMVQESVATHSIAVIDR